jgi:signal transduction histidine kinase/ActR/RegA family two-component response regulator
MNRDGPGWERPACGANLDSPAMTITYLDGFSRAAVNHEGGPPAAVMGAAPLHEADAATTVRAPIASPEAAEAERVGAALDLVREARELLDQPLDAAATLDALEALGARAARAARGPDSAAEAAASSRRPRARDREKLLLLEKVARADAEMAMHRISTLQTVTAALSEAVTLQQVADIIVGEGVSSLGAQNGALYLLDAGRTHLELIACRGISPEGSQAIARVATAGADTARWAEPVWAADVGEVRAAFPRIATTLDAIDPELVLAALAAVPLSVGGSVAGVLFLGFEAPQRFPEEERVFTLALMRHCAQAIDRARLFEAERRSNRRLELLAKVGELLSSSIDYETTLANVARSALPVLGDYCLFDVIEDEGVRRVARSSGDSVASQIDGARFAASARLGAKPRALYAEIDDAVLGGLAPTADHVPLLRRLDLRSLLTVPVMARHQTLGWLTLAFGPSGRHHGGADLEIAEELAHRAAIAVENATLHRQSREATLRAQEANRRSELANRTKDEFLGVVSHELRTPLNAVLGWSQLLRGPCAADPAVLAKGLRVIDKNARAQAKLIEDILDVSRIITGKLRLELGPLELERVLRTSLEVIRPAADAKGVELRSTVEARPTVSGDPDRLQQVVWNLLSNAVKFTPQGGRVDITLRRGRAAAEIVVQDSGRGIEPEFIPYVFERFRQADSSPTRRHGGLGLGLAIVRHLVELHGGTVRAESQGLGRGSTFTVRLPAREEDIPDHESRALRDTDPGPQTMRVDELRVLVVDDEADARELVATMLGAAGAEVVTAGSAAEAMEALSIFAPDVLVSDIGMPGEDGYAMIRKVRALGGKLGRIPALALTAYASPEDARRAVVAGFQTHLCKPAEPSVLTAVVASLGGRITG